MLTLTLSRDVINPILTQGNFTIPLSFPVTLYYQNKGKKPEEELSLKRKILGNRFMIPIIAVYVKP